MERLVLRVLARLHREQPLSHGFRTDAIIARVVAESGRPRPPRSHRGGGGAPLEATAVDEALAVLEHRGRVDRAGRRVALPGIAPELDPETRRRADDVLAALRAAGMHPPPVRILAHDAGLPERAVEFLRERGELIAVAPEIDLPPETVRDAERAFRQLAAAEGAVRAARFRDVIGTGRRHAVALLEYLDSIGVSQRDGDRHLPAGGADEHVDTQTLRAVSDEHDTRGVP